MVLTEQQSQLDFLLYNRDEVHRHSPAVQKLFDLALNYVSDAEKASLQGKNVIWSGGLWETPLVYASDTIPVAYSEMGRISGKEAITVAEDYYQMPAETCSMVKATVGEWHLRKNSPIKKIFGNSSACEPFNLAWELMKKEGYDVYNIDVIYRAPGVKGERFEELVKYFVNEIYDFAYWLTGTKKIDEKRLSYEIKRKNSLMLKVRRILDLRLKNPFYVKSLAAMYLMTGLNNYFGKPDEFEQVVNGLLEELEAEEADEQALKDVVPIVWVGGTGQEFGIYETIDNSNGALLGFINTPYRYYDETIPPVESLARFLLGGPGAGASVYGREVIEQQIERINARGLILYGYLGCSFGSVQREMYRDYFHKKGIPSINLEGSFQVGSPSGQVLTRVKAFVEMLS